MALAENSGLMDDLAHDIAATRAPLGRASHAPGYVYTSEEIYALEKEKIFMRDWLCVARVEEVEHPGDYMTFQVMDEPIIIARATDNTISAFRNSCAHRGLAVAHGTGNTKTFTCLFHGWSYDLAGQLVGAPFMDDEPGFDLSSCRLPPLQCDTWEGWIFVSFDLDAPSLTDFMAPFDDEFAVLGMGRCRTGYRQVWDLKCNWKIMNENNHDLYHVHATHADTFGAGITSDQLHFNLRDKGRISSFYSDPPLQPDGKSLFEPMPWLKNRPYDFACIGHMPPNLVLVGRCDSSVAVISWPVSVNETRLLAYQLFPEAAFEDPDLEAKLKKYDDFVHVILTEDTGIVAETHKAVAQENYRPGPISRLESNIHHCLNHYFDQVFGD